MQIIVVSDSHGDYTTFDKLLKSKPNANTVIFCGDGYNDFIEVKKHYPDKRFIGVRGNCDWSCPLKNSEVVTIEGVKFYICHGHVEGVKYGLDGLKKLASAQGARVALYGHTHIPHIEHDNGMWIMNSGSLRRFECSYGLIDIQNGQVLMNTAVFKS